MLRLMRKLKIYHLLFYLIILFTLGCSSERSTDQSQPNIIFILIGFIFGLLEIFLFISDLAYHFKTD